MCERRVYVVVRVGLFEYDAVFVMEKKRILRQFLVRYGWLLLILLTAVFLRTYQLSSIPPGLTHDEADHGITAISVLDGARDVYFTIGYGREPLFDYATAVLMSGLGTTYVVGRITAVIFSLIMIAGMTAWVHLAFDRNTALLTAAGLAVGFWPVMAARQSLRSISLPALFALTVWLFWLGIRRLEIGDLRSRDRRLATLISNLQSPISIFIIAGCLLGLTFYTYIPSRGMWVLFPLVLVYLFLVRRDLFRKSWRGLLLMLLVAGIVALPLLLYLRANPTVEVRIAELSAPLTAVATGDFSGLWQNVLGGLKIISIVGDTAWRYNIPERPLLPPIMSLLFWLGVIIALWFVLKPIIKRKPDDVLLGTASFLALCWLALGLGPVLITGPFLSTTQAMGMQPVLYLFPALTIGVVGRLEIGDWRLDSRVWFWGGAIALFVGTMVMTYRDYFVVWANEPEVRVQYESTMAEAMRYLNESGARDTAVSTITPHQYHTPALAQLTLNETAQPRWFDGRGSLIVPKAEESTILFPGFAPLHPALNDYFERAQFVEMIPLRETDVDRPLEIYEVDRDTLLDGWQAQFVFLEDEVRLGDTAVLQAYDLRTPTMSPDGVVQLVTLWQLQDAVEGVRLFTHLLAEDGVPFAQADRLDAPSESWIAGDWLLQIHEFMIPPETAVGEYPITIGMYTCLDELCQQTERFPIFVNGEPVGDTFEITKLRIE